MPEETQFNALPFYIYSIHMYAYISSLRSLLIAFLTHSKHWLYDSRMTRLLTARMNDQLDEPYLF